MVAGQYQYLLGTVEVQVEEVLLDGIRRALEPVRIGQRLFGGQYAHERPGKKIEPVGIVYMVIEGFRVKLSQNIDIFYSRSQAVGHGYIDKPVFAADRHRGFIAIHRKGIQPFTLSSSEYQCDYLFHE